MKGYMNRLVWMALVLGIALSACKGKKAKADEKNSSKQDYAMETSKHWMKWQADSTVLIWIQDNAEEKLMPRGLFPDAPDSLMYRLGLEAGVPSTVSVFLMEREGCLILFDAGNGMPDSRLMEGLREARFAPEDIRYVYLTHFHGDHIGGMMRGDTAMFPNAEVYASRAEYDAWMQMPADKNAQVVKTMEAYRERLHLFAFGDALPCGVQPMDGVGHTPGHTLYQTGHFLVVGDLMHGTALQLAHPEICASFDMDMPRAVETRKRCLAYVRAEGLTMAGMHFPPEGFIALK